MINKSRSCARFRTALFAFTALAAPIAMIATPAVAKTQQREQTYAFNIPAQPLPRALASVARTARLQLIFADGEPSGVQSRAIRGRMTATEAFSRLTAGTGYEAYYSAPGVVTLRPVPAAVADDGSRVLGPVRVEGAQSTFAYSGGPERGDGIAQLGGVRGGQDDEATGYRPNVASIAAGAPAAIEDIPRSISVLSQEQIQKQDIETLGDALRRLPGVAVVETNNSNLNEGAQVLSRGFAVRQIQIDGGASRPLNIVGNGLMELGAYERVELVRGPNGAFAGGGSPGGGLNLVRKRPGVTESLEISGTVGSFDRYGAQVDFSTPSLGGSAFAFRGVASVSDQNFFYENGAKRTALLYGVVDAPLGERARLELGAQYSRVNETAPYSGKYRYFEGPIIDFGGYYYNLSGAWSYDHSSNADVFARLYLDLMENLDLEVGFDLQTGEQTRERLTNSSPLFLEANGTARDARISAGFQSYETYNQSFNFKFFGTRSFWGLKHDFLLAGDLTESGSPQFNERYGAMSLTASDTADYLELIRGFQPVYLPFTAYGEINGTSSRTGLSISDTISWRDLVVLSLSARRNSVESSGANVAISDNGLPNSIHLPEAVNGSQTSEPGWLPNWSLAVKPWRNLTVYGTRAEGEEELLTPKFTVSGASLGPSTYENLEGGVKVATDRWLATLAYYDVTQNNVAEAIWGTVCPPSNSMSTPCYHDATQTVRSRGVDFEVSGEILAGLNLQANYNWGDFQITGGGGRAATQTPVHAGQIFVDWSPEFLPGTSLRGGLRYRSEVYQSGIRRVLDPVTLKVIASGPYDFTEEPYFLWDFGVRRQLTRNVALDLFVENITDVEYLSTISSVGGNFPGAPRTFTATLRWKADEGFLGSGSTTGRAPFGDPADWYASIDLGAHAAADLDATGDGPSQDGTTPVNWTFETQDGFAGAARIGYRFGPSLRGELEGSFRTTEFGDIGGGAAAPFGVCGASYADLGVAFDCDDALGDADAWALMANGLYDFGGEDGRFRPYLGVGLGVLKTSIDFSGKMEGIGLDTPWNYDGARKLQEAIGGDSSNMTFAYQLLAGLSYRLTPQATIDVTYRYFEAPEVRWSSFNLSGVGGYPEYGSPIFGLAERIGDFEAAYSDQSLTVGLRWAFGVR